MADNDELPNSERATDPVPDGVDGGVHLPPDAPVPIDFDTVYDEAGEARGRLHGIQTKLMKLRKDYASYSLTALQEIAQLQVEVGELERLIRRIERRTEPRIEPSSVPPK